MPKKELTAERLRELLDYDPDAGIFVWKKVNSNRLKVGDIGSVVAIGIDGVRYPTARLAWLYIRDEMPACEVVHRDGDATNNRFSNLLERRNICLPRETPLTVDRLRQVLEYDQATGILRWRITNSRRAKAGQVAGTRRPRGEVAIRVDGRIYLAHRLVWLHVTGQWPEHTIDHKNLDPSDNRFANLRQATDSQNKFNKRTRPDNRTGLKGVTLDRRDSRYSARIRANGKKFSLGYYDTAEEAHVAYCMASTEIHGQFGRTK